MIKVHNLSKTFRKPIRGEGIWQMFISLFSRKYEEIKAVKNIDFEINDGEIVGYIGSNGAGKSTTIKMMCGIMIPTGGRIDVEGLDPFKERTKIASKIGVVFGQKSQLWWDIPLIESFKVLKDIYLVSDEDYNEKMEFLNNVLGINDFITQPVRTLSLGQRMRADLAAAWLHNPKILFLDEPTIGLDVLVKEHIREAIKEMNKKYHTTVILTTHDMDDIEDLCSRVILIEKGSIIYDGPLADIKNKFGNIKTVTITSKIDDIESLNTLDNKLSFKYNNDNSKLTIKFDADKISTKEVVNYSFDYLNTTDLEIKSISIEDVVKEILESNEKV